MTITYAVEPNLSADEFIDVLERSTLAERRPVDDRARIERMLRSATVICTARKDRLIVGVARAISDGVYCTYLSDLAVDESYQGKGIGKQLLEFTHQHSGPRANLILLAAPKAATYYPHIGLQPHDSCWIQPGIESVEPTAEANDDGQNALLNKDSSGVEPFFDSISQEYDEAILRCFPRYNEMLDLLVDYLPSQHAPNLKILELGCGTGNLTRRVAQRFPDAELTIVDVSTESLDVCRQNNAGREMKALAKDMRELDFSPATFDMIVSSIAIHHLTSAEKQELFNRCQTWLRSEGILSFADQFSSEEKSIYQRHVEQWKSISFQAGASENEWNLWMEHQQAHDYHDSLPDQLDWLSKAGFRSIDCPWRYLLWTIIQARR